MLEYGTLGMDERRDIYFAVVNRNPITTILRGWGSNHSDSLVELMGVERGDVDAIESRSNFSDMSRMLAICPGCYMVFRIGVMTNRMEEDVVASVFVETDFHATSVLYHYNVAKGSLHTVPRELSFEPAFPVRVRIFAGAPFNILFGAFL